MFDPAMMELALRVLFGTLFLSTSVSKLKKLYLHEAIVADYKILPAKLVPLFAKLEVIVELLVGLLFLLGLFHGATAATAILLLLAYNFAMSVNLLRGRREISCGCGGVVGNHHLSWTLVLRNFALAAVAGWLLARGGSDWGSLQAVFSGKPFGDVFHYAYWQTVLYCYAFLVIALGVGELLALKKRMAEMLIPKSTHS